MVHVVSAIEVQDGNNCLGKVSMEEIGKNQDSANSWFSWLGKKINFNGAKICSFFSF